MSKRNKNSREELGEKRVKITTPNDNAEGTVASKRNKNSREELGEKRVKITTSNDDVEGTVYIVLYS